MDTKATEHRNGRLADLRKKEIDGTGNEEGHFFHGNLLMPSDGLWGMGYRVSPITYTYYP
jgi:hypothetical protein